MLSGRAFVSGGKILKAGVQPGTNIAGEDGLVKVLEAFLNEYAALKA